MAKYLNSNKNLILMLMLCLWSLFGLSQARPHNISLNDIFINVDDRYSKGVYFSVNPSLERSVASRRSVRFSLPLEIGANLKGVGIRAGMRWYKNAPKPYIQDSTSVNTKPNNYFCNRGLYLGFEVEGFYDVNNYTDVRNPADTYRKDETFNLALPFFIGKQWIGKKGFSFNLAGGITPKLHYTKSANHDWQLSDYFFGYLGLYFSYGIGYSF